MLKFILFPFLSFAVPLMLPISSTAADYYYGSLYENSLVVDFGNDDIEAEVKTITAINSQGATTLTLKKMAKKCKTYCQDIEEVGPQTVCHYEGVYPIIGKPANFPKYSMVFKGKKNISNFISVKQKDKAPTAIDLINQWKSTDFQGVSVYSHQGFVQQPEIISGRWKWESNSEEFISESNGHELYLPKDQLERCKTFASESFKSLNCDVTRKGYGYTFGWLYLGKNFFFAYGCDDCSVPELMVSASFLLDKNPHYVITDSTGYWGSWIVKKTEKGGSGLSFGETNYATCH